MKDGKEGIDGGVTVTVIGGFGFGFGIGLGLGFSTVGAGDEVGGGLREGGSGGCVD